MADFRQEYPPNDRIAVGERVRVRDDVPLFAGWEGVVVIDDGSNSTAYKVDFGDNHSSWVWLDASEVVVLDD
jgi:hypothetical protein